MGAEKIHMDHEGAPSGGCTSPVSASTAHLKVNGTAMVASLATNRSTVASTTRSLRSARSEGQINGHRCTSVRSSAPRSAETGLKLAGGCGAFIWIRSGLSGTYRGFRRGKHPPPFAPRLSAGNVQDQWARLHVGYQADRLWPCATNDGEHCRFRRMWRMDRRGGRIARRACAQHDGWRRIGRGARG